MKYLCLLSLSVLFIISSCDDMNDLHDIYLQEGERIYVGKVDSAYMFPGKNRVKMRFWSKDPRATKMMVYWSGRSDSLLVNIESEVKGDSTELIINNLPERDHFFEIVTMNDALMNRSIPYLVSGKAYGDQFSKSIFNRAIKAVSVDTITGYWDVEWLGKVDKGIGSEIVYSNQEGIDVHLYVPMENDHFEVEDSIQSIKYRTLFLPTIDAIDTFRTDFIEYKLD